MMPTAALSLGLCMTRVPGRSMGLGIRKNVLSKYKCGFGHSSYASGVILPSLFHPFRGHYTGTTVKVMWVFFPPFYRYLMNSAIIIFCTVKDNNFSLPLKLIGFHYYFHWCQHFSAIYFYLLLQHTDTAWFLCTICCNGVSWRTRGVITHLGSAAVQGAASSAAPG